MAGFSTFSPAHGLAEDNRDTSTYRYLFDSNCPLGMNALFLLVLFTLPMEESF